MKRSLSSNVLMLVDYVQVSNVVKTSTIIIPDSLIHSR